MTGPLAQATAAPAIAEAVVFWVFAVVGLGAALAMITLRNIVHAALMLVVNFLAIAVLFLALQSSFLAIIQVIVYAGAIMVLFLFVIMLLGVNRDDLLEARRWQQVGAVAGGLALAALLVFAFVGTHTSAASRCGDQAGPAPAGRDVAACAGLETVVAGAEGGSVGVVAQQMFTRYTFAFEAAALLLVVATVGALILGRRHDPDPDQDRAYATAPRRRGRDLPGRTVDPDVVAVGRPGAEAPPREAGG